MRERESGRRSPVAESLQAEELLHNYTEELAAGHLREKAIVRHVEEHPVGHGGTHRNPNAWKTEAGGWGVQGQP